MLIIAASSRNVLMKMMRTTVMRSSYRIGNQIRLAKHVLNIGQIIVGIHIISVRKQMNPTRMVVVHLPLGANRSRLRARIPISIPKTRVIIPKRKIAVQVSRARD